MDTAEDVLKDLAVINGVKVVASFNTTTGKLSWNGQNPGGLLLQHELLGIFKENWAIRLQLLPFVQGGGLKGAKRDINGMLISFEQPESATIWYDAIQDFLQRSGRPKRLLVLINPCSGKGDALRVYKRIVEPLLDAAGITVTVRETQFQRHAKDMAKTINISKFDGIACVSGDGILVEVLNGLLERDDWEQAIRIPIGAIPAGSGNGLAKSLLAASGEPCDIWNATFAIIKGLKQSLDVATVVQGQARFHSILLLCWGYIADVDIESEKYRWMGGFRFQFYSILLLISLRRYHGSIAYIPAPGYEETGSPYMGELDSFPGESKFTVADTERSWRTSGYSGQTGSASMKDWRAMSGPFILLMLQNIPWATEDFLAAPSAKFSDGCLDLVVLKDCSRWTLLKLVLQMQKGTHIKSKYVQYLKVKALRMAPGGRTKGSVQGGYIDVDGEVIARGEGAEGDGSNDLMIYGPRLDISVQQGLATMFIP